MRCLVLNRGTYSELISYSVGTASDGSPTLLSNAPRSEITFADASLDKESAGLAVTGPGLSVYPLGGVLDWFMLTATLPR